MIFLDVEKYISAKEFFLEWFEIVVSATLLNLMKF